MKVGTEQGWQAARKELLAAERELEEHAQRVEEQRRGLPWVPVEKEYEFATEGEAKSLPELFEGRSQLLIYHLMFGGDWEVPCPGCSSLADGLSGTVGHLNDRDVTLVCMSQAPLEKLVSYKQRGWTVPWARPAASPSSGPSSTCLSLTRPTASTSTRSTANASHIAQGSALDSRRNTAVLDLRRKLPARFAG